MINYWYIWVFESNRQHIPVIKRIKENIVIRIIGSNQYIISQINNSIGVYQ